MNYDIANTYVLPRVAICKPVSGCTIWRGLPFEDGLRGHAETVPYSREVRLDLITTRRYVEDGEVLLIEDLLDRARDDSEVIQFGWEFFWGAFWNWREMVDRRHPEKSILERLCQKYDIPRCFCCLGTTFRLMNGGRYIPFFNSCCSYHGWLPGIVSTNELANSSVPALVIESRL